MDEIIKNILSKKSTGAYLKLSDKRNILINYVNQKNIYINILIEDINKRKEEKFEEEETLQDIVTNRILFKYEIENLKEDYDLKSYNELLKFMMTNEFFDKKNIIEIINYMKNNFTIDIETYYILLKYYNKNYKIIGKILKEMKNNKVKFNTKIYNLLFKIYYGTNKEDKYISLTDDKMKKYIKNISSRDNFEYTNKTLRKRHFVSFSEQFPKNIDVSRFNSILDIYFPNIKNMEYLLSKEYWNTETYNYFLHLYIDDSNKINDLLNDIEEYNIETYNILLTGNVKGNKILYICNSDEEKYEITRIFESTFLNINFGKYIENNVKIVTEDKAIKYIDDYDLIYFDSYDLMSIDTIILLEESRKRDKLNLLNTTNDSIIGIDYIKTYELDIKVQKTDDILEMLKEKNRELSENKNFLLFCSDKEYIKIKKYIMKIKNISIVDDFYQNVEEGLRKIIISNGKKEISLEKNADIIFDTLKYDGSMVNYINGTDFISKTIPLTLYDRRKLMLKEDGEYITSKLSPSKPYIDTLNDYSPSYIILSFLLREVELDLTYTKFIDELNLLLNLKFISEETSTKYYITESGENYFFNYTYFGPRLYDVVKDRYTNNVIVSVIFNFDPSKFFTQKDKRKYNYIKKGSSLDIIVQVWNKFVKELRLEGDIVNNIEQWCRKKYINHNQLIIFIRKLQEFISFKLQDIKLLEIEGLDFIERKITRNCYKDYVAQKKYKNFTRGIYHYKRKYIPKEIINYNKICIISHDNNEERTKILFYYTRSRGENIKLRRFKLNQLTFNFENPIEINNSGSILEYHEKLSDFQYKSILEEKEDKFDEELLISAKKLTEAKKDYLRKKFLKNKY